MMILLNLSKRTTKALEELAQGKPLKVFIKDQLLEMAIAKAFNVKVEEAEKKIEAIKMELQAIKRSMKEEIDK